MSYYVTVVCEGETSPGERCWAEDSPLGDPRTASEARRRLAAAGWRRTRDGRDLCPACVASLAGQPSSAPAVTR
ncbi:MULTISPECIES: hypothetical protein [Streptomyces]|uniref:hypothetical protein n=1 Tax=Streptomyces TaxID=1883 RepID=UPI00190394DA|nr:hypothetical protein [Streptomyces sp. XC 2026]QQN79756.1 hypothetical protein IPZ77_21765 [Streptomyces sp. XC 2026]QQN80636.1 hypothetical protein IPZ77_26890 [Streptomyces sp. XC 2026]